MIFEKSEKIVIVSNEDLENVVGGNEVKDLVFNKFPDGKRNRSFYISGGCALVVALVGLGICTISRVKKFFK